MGKRIFLLALGAMLFALSSPADAQQVARIPRIGFLSVSGDPKAPGPWVEAFRQGLRDLGYTEGKNVLVEYRYIEGKLDRIPSLVAELVQLKIDVLVLVALSSIRAAKQSTKTIPIVMAINGNPVTLGLVDSLARPGGNITGLTSLNRELSGKRLELFNEVVPRISRVGILTDATSTTGSSTGLEEYEAAARAIKMPLQSLKVRGPSPDLEDVFRAAVKARVSALISVRAGVLLPYTKTIADLAIKNRLPLMFEGSGLVESYSPNDTEFHRRAATYVDKILKGAKPADLPVEQPMKFEFVINLKTAKQIGLTIPQTVLYRADRVIK